VFAGALIGTIPDLDVVAGLAGDWASLVHHRGISHSLIFAPVMCFPLGWLAHKWAKRGMLAQWVHLAFWALLTHPVLDAFTPYGTQLFAPFSQVRIAWDGISIIDPLYTCPLLLALLVAWLGRRRPRVGASATWLALALTSAYVGFGFAQSQRALHAAESALERGGFEVQQVRAVPTLANVFAWRIVARDAAETIAVGIVSTLNPGPIAFEFLERPSTPMIDAALADERGRITKWFAMDMLSYRVETDSEGRTVLWCDDQRYGRMTAPAESLWSARFMFDESGAVEDAAFVYAEVGVGDLAAELRALLGAIAGEHVSP
jgi:inner membrane protein